jgi:hypothetical protein
VRDSWTEAARRTSAFAQRHPIVFVCLLALPTSIAVGLAEELSGDAGLAGWLYATLLGTAAVIGTAAGVGILNGYYLWDAAADARRRKRIETIQAQIEDPDLPEQRRAVVERLREGAVVIGGPERRAELAARGREIEDKVLAPARARLLTAGQAQLAAQFVLSNRYKDRVDLAAEVDRLLEQYVSWQTPIRPREFPAGAAPPELPPPPFRFGKEARKVDKRLEAKLAEGLEMSRDVARAENAAALRKCLRRFRKWDRRSRRIMRKDGGPWEIDFGPRDELRSLDANDEEQLERFVDAKVHRLRVMLGRERR